MIALFYRYNITTIPVLKKKEFCRVKNRN